MGENEDDTADQIGLAAGTFNLVCHRLQLYEPPAKEEASDRHPKERRWHWRSERRPGRDSRPWLNN